MNEPFIITLTYQGTEHEFKARFERWGYTHRIAVLIDETTFTFEPDEKAVTGRSPTPNNLLQQPRSMYTCSGRSLKSWPNLTINRALKSPGLQTANK